MRDAPDFTQSPCPDCGAWHDGGRCGHDRKKQCRYCTRPVGDLSTGGPDVCSCCEVVGVPFDIFTGRKPPRDFHAPEPSPTKDRDMTDNFAVVRDMGKPGI